ncbi:hypothetical protein, partial [Escherichia coli]|uniref:hypothetical protein n=1 Tax=Escherichia coli TaxID=562 RepID=UPI003078CD80
MNPYPDFTLNHFTVPVTLVARTSFSLAGALGSSGLVTVFSGSAMMVKDGKWVVIWVQPLSLMFPTLA